MKKQLLKLTTLCMLLLTASTVCAKSLATPSGSSASPTPVEIEINVTNFPDENFRNDLLEQDYGRDGVLTEEEIEGITSIYVPSKGISSLKGIEYFTTLTRLTCYDNQLTALDVSKNTALTGLDCSRNQLTVLDVSKNTGLTYLNCSYNQLTALDVSKNTALTGLYCFINQLTALDVSKNTALTSLSCYDNQLTALDVSKNTALTELACSTNQLTALNVSNNTALTGLNLNRNQLTVLDVSKNTGLTYLNCSYNQLTALDVSKNTELTNLLCYGNNINGEAMTALINSLPENNSGKNFYFRAIYDQTDETNILTKSQVAAVKAKGWFPQYYNSGWKLYEGSDDEGGDELTPVEIDINVTNFPDDIFRNWLLVQNYGKDGVLTEEEIEGITAINVTNKGISSLKGIEYFTALIRLYCDKNQLTALDVSKNTSLIRLDCYKNQLTALDVSNNTALRNLSCYNNQLTALDVSNTALTTLYCDKNQLTTLDVSKNTALTTLYCYNNQLTALDVSKNTALTTLYCYNNQLTALDVSKNTVLTHLECYNNQLTALDVSKNTVLTELLCHENQLTALDVSNTALTTLYCHNNQLTTLDVSKNTALTALPCYKNNIKGEAMTALINSLPNNISNNDHYFRAIFNPTDETNILTKSQVAVVKAKGWIPEYYGSGWEEYEGSDDESGEDPTIEKCEKPTILYANGELTFGCATEGVEFHWSINNGTNTDGKGSKVTFSPKTTVSVYASKDGYQDSDTATLVISGSGLKGDVNNNGGIDIGDAVTIVNFLVGKTATLSRGTEDNENMKEPQ